MCFCLFGLDGTSRIYQHAFDFVERMIEVMLLLSGSGACERSDGFG